LQSVLRDLARFQELSLEVSRLDRRIAQIPSDIKVIDAEEKTASRAVARAKESLEESKRSRRDAEARLQDLEQQIEKYNDQSRQVKTNEQYRAIMSEIEGVKKRIGDVEETILLAMDEADRLEAEIGEAEKSFQEHRKEFDSRRKTLEEEKATLAAERDRVTSEKRSVSERIPADAMEAYQRVAGARGEIVVARAMDQRCQVCNVRLRPQIYSEIRRSERLINCESCNRILYYIEEPPAGKEGPSKPSSTDAGGEGTATGPDTA
jgi:predicted  nucleic acid-binding Zn-ribbon protein